MRYYWYGSFLKWGYLQIIHLSGIFPSTVNQPAIGVHDELETPISNHPKVDRSSRKFASSKFFHSRFLASATGMAPGGGSAPPRAEPVIMGGHCNSSPSCTWQGYPQQIFYCQWIARENLNQKPSIFPLRSWGFLANVPLNQSIAIDPRNIGGSFAESS